ncbi:PAS domain-containing protein [Amaricoccus macauensis]|uniref:PAS domain-containing protein n=1 Tax=Amaricoccus macauensis TaxID=57001 RepID=UPI003C7AAC38
MVKIEAALERWNLWNDRMMGRAVRHARIPLSISDPNLPENPIVFCNQAFIDLTGYSGEEIIGKNCRLLQGAETTAQSVREIRSILQSLKVDTVEIVNYRKDGSKFLNALQIGPIFDEDGNLAYFFGSQLDVTAKREAEEQARKLANAELLHRLRNIVNVMSAIIRMTARQETDPRTLGSLIAERLATLSDAHFQFLRGVEDDGLHFDEIARTILKAYAFDEAEGFALSGPDVALPVSAASCLALILHELATNSIKHGAFSTTNGVVRLSWKIRDLGASRSVAFCWQESGGPPVSMPKRNGGFRIINDLIAVANGSIDMHWPETGLVVEVELPM